MADEKWTPGPWRYQEEGDAYTHIVRASRNKFVTGFPQGTKGEDEANARLTAAAPELYEALGNARSFLALFVSPQHGDTIAGRAFAEIDGALSKARGEVK